MALRRPGRMVARDLGLAEVYEAPDEVVIIPLT